MSVYEKGVITILGCDVLLAAIAIPLMLRKVPRNFVYGFRTPATLSDDRIWYEANAYFGTRLVLASVVGALAIVTLSRASLSARAFLNSSIAALVVPGLLATVATFRFVGALKRGKGSP
jgi:uncharacterized membrane protein